MKRYNVIDLGNENATNMNNVTIEEVKNFVKEIYSDMIEKDFNLLEKDLEQNGIEAITYYFSLSDYELEEIK